MKKVILFLSVIALTSCGGGGGDGPNSNPPVIDTGPSIYWSSLSSIRKIGKNSGQESPAVYLEADYAGGIAIDSSNIYWLGLKNHNIGKAKKSTGEITYLATGVAFQSFPGQTPIAVDSTHVYWVEGDAGAGSIKKININGGVVTTLASSRPSPVNLVVDSTNVYWTDRTGFVSKVGINGGAVTDFISYWEGYKGAPSGIAVDDTSVYWTENTGDYQTNTFIGLGALRKTGLNGGPIVTLVTGLTTPSNLAIHENNVYWIEDSENMTGNGAKIMKVNINGGATSVVAPWLITPRGIAIDSTNIYSAGWRNIGDNTGCIYKVGLNSGVVTELAKGTANPGTVVIDP